MVVTGESQNNYILLFKLCVIELSSLSFIKGDSIACVGK